MIGFDEACSHLGRGLAVLRADPTTAIATADVDHAIAARDAVLRLARSITRTGSLGRGATRPTADPSALWITSVQRTPLVGLDQAHDLLAAQASTATGRLWGKVHRMGVVAEHHWQNSAVASRPRGAQAWSLLADTAALTGAIAELDPALEHQLRTAGRDPDADTIAQSTTSRLAQASADAMHQARTGDLPSINALVPLAPGRTVPLDPEAHGVAKAWDNLLGNLRQSEPSPQQMRAVLTAVVDTAHAVLPDDVRAEWVTAIARVNRELGRLRSLTAGRGESSVIQAQLIARFTPTTHPTAAAEHAAACAPELVRRVASTVVTTLRERDWLIADGTDHTAPLWTTAHRCPELTAAITTARGRANAVANYGVPITRAIAQIGPPRDHLLAAPVPRPAAPGMTI